MLNSLKIFSLISLTILNITSLLAQPTSITPPVANLIPDTTIIHGDTLIDPYAWLRQKKHHSAINYFEAENGYTQRMTKHTKPFQQQLYREIKSRFKEADQTLPEKIDQYYYYTRWEKGKDYGIFCRKKDSLQAIEAIILDENKLAAGNPFINVVATKVSPSHQRLGYSVDYTGARRMTVYFKDLQTDSTDTNYLHNVGQWVWGNEETVFYTQLDTAIRDLKVYRHQVGQPQRLDQLVFEEEDITQSITLGKTKSREYLTLNVLDNGSNEIYLLHKDSLDQPFQLFQARIKEHSYALDHHQGTFFLLSDFGDPDKDRQIMTTDRAHTSLEHWQTFLPSRKGIRIESMAVFEEYVVLLLRDHGLDQLQIISRKDTTSHYIKFNESSYSINLMHGQNFQTQQFRFGYQSMVTPRTIYEYNMATREMALLKQDSVVGPYRSADYETKRIVAMAADSTMIPISLVYKKGMQPDGSNPMLLTGYGAYGAPSDVYFSASRISLMDRGVIIAEAHIRGGGDLGYPWYKEGKLFQKQNTFTDFIAVAEHLIKEGYTSPEHLVIEGTSAGGLLIGAVVNKRPDLFKAAVLNVPFVDVINTMLDASIPLTTYEYDEWGNPNNPSYYHYMKSYSPYDNIRPQAYPAMLIQGGYNDTQVGVWEPAKFTAKLRNLKTDSNLLLLNISMSGGHGMVSGRENGYKHLAFEYAFILDQLGLKPDYITIRGKVRDENGTPLPYVNVIVEGTSKGTITNDAGEFELELRQGQYNLSFQYIGFNNQLLPLSTEAVEAPLEITLNSESIVLHQVTVSSKYDDPAYWMVKNAIAKRKHHLQQVQGYSCDIYIKGVDRLTEVPKSLPPFIPKSMLPDSDDLGLMYLSESVSRLHFQQPDLSKEQMYASKVSGMKDGYSWNRATDILINFYHNLLKVDYLTERGLVSPISDNALFFYKYQYMGSVEENGKTMNKIKVTPKRKADPVFEGYIYLQDDAWRITKADLFLTNKQVEYYDTLYVKQDYYPVNDSVWMPLSLQFFAHVKIFGFEGTETYLNFYDNYVINPEFDKRFFNNEIFRIEAEANKKDTVYWKTTRPILLTQEEKADYAKHDSLQAIQDTKAYKDSIDRKYNKVNPLDLFLYGFYNYSTYNNRSISTNALIENVQFNTVEGVNISLKGAYDKWYQSSNKSIGITNTVRYGVSNRHFNDQLAIRYSYQPKRFASVRLVGGKYVFQFNDAEPIHPLLNSVYTLAGEQNYMKLYEKAFVQLEHQQEVVNGLLLKGAVGFEERYPLQNNNDFVLNDWERWAYTSNDPQAPNNQQPGITQHRALLFHAEAKVRFKQVYSLRPKAKIIEGSKYPTLRFTYDKAIPGVAGSVVNYDLLTASAGDDVKMGLFGYMRWDVKVGAFLNHAQVPFIDRQHFNGNQTLYLKQDNSWTWLDQSPNPLSQFQLLDYYSHSTDQHFLEAHVEHHFRGFLMNKLPLVRKAKVFAVASGNALYTPSQGEYLELGAGLENIGKLFRVDLVTSYNSNGKVGAGLRIGYLNDF